MAVVWHELEGLFRQLFPRDETGRVFISEHVTLGFCVTRDGTELLGGGELLNQWEPILPQRGVSVKFQEPRHCSGATNNVDFETNVK